MKVLTPYHPQLQKIIQSEFKRQEFNLYALVDKL
jgi:hypothetical protein